MATTGSILRLVVVFTFGAACTLSWQWCGRTGARLRECFGGPHVSRELVSPDGRYALVEVMSGFEDKAIWVEWHRTPVDRSGLCGEPGPSSYIAYVYDGLLSDLVARGVSLTPPGALVHDGLGAEVQWPIRLVDIADSGAVDEGETPD